MKQPSEAYVVAQHIHDTFSGENGVLTDDEIWNAGARLDPDSQPYHTSKIYIRGDYWGRDAYQTLSRSKAGIYYMSTIYAEKGGAHTVTKITPNAPLEKLGELVTSLYMGALVEIANARPE